MYFTWQPCTPPLTGKQPSAFISKDQENPRANLQLCTDEELPEQEPQPATEELAPDFSTEKKFKLATIAAAI